MPETLALVVVAGLTGTVGALGGIGGAVFLVPVLVLAGWEPSEAARLGMLSVAAASLAAAEPQLRDGLVHQRLGVTVEMAAGAGAIVGAVAATALGATALSRVLAVTTLLAAAATFPRRALRNQPVGAFAAEPPGEWRGTLGGAYRLGDHVIPYSVRRAWLGVGLMGTAGCVAGISGTSGGFLKTPILSEVMRVPVKVAAATTTFTVGLTATTALLVYLRDGGFDVRAGSAIALGGLVGGRLGVRLQATLSPRTVRRALSALLLVVAVLLLGGAS